MRMLAGLLSVLMASPSFAGSGIFLAPQGPVEVKAADGSTMILAHKAELVPGEEVHTGDASAAMVTLTDGSKLLLSPDARFKVGSSNTNETTFELAAGKLRAYFAGVFSGRLKIQTPTAVCAVRGTEFELSADGAKGTNVTVAEGHLEVSDNTGRTTVVTSEETLNVGSRGMTEPPHMVPLHSEMAQAAARPFAVALEMGKSATRQMIEDLRNRELKANEAQLGKSVIDAFGNRVRLEEYLLRPAGNQFEVLFLNQAKNTFNWGNITETFNSTLPNDPMQISQIASNTFFSSTRPSNWLTNLSFFATNTVDSVAENVALTAPTPVSFAGYSLGTLYYPASQTFTQTLSGPGVFAKTGSFSRTQFEQTQSVSGNVFTYSQYAPNPSGVLTKMDTATLDVSNAANVAAGVTSFTINDHPTYDPVLGATTYPSGPNKADYLTSTSYADGSTVSVEKFLVSNDGNVLDFSNASQNSFATPGNYNMEDVINSNMFQGRQINVLIAPEILAQTNSATANANGANKTFQP